LSGGEEHFHFVWHKTIAQKHGNDGSGKEERTDNGVDDRGDDYGQHRLGIVGGNDARPQSDDSKKDLQADDGVKPDASARDFGNLRESAAKRGGGPKHHRENNGSAEDVGFEREIAVAKAGTRENLNEDDERVEGNNGVNRRGAAVFVLGEVLHPPTAGEESDADEDDENELSGAGMHDGKPVMEELQDSEAAENALENNATDRDEAEIANGGAFVVAPKERGENDNEQTEGRSDEAMRVFESDAADHGRVEGAVRKRPIGDS